MITDRDREELAEMGLVLAPTVREQMCTQRYYLAPGLQKFSLFLKTGDQLVRCQKSCLFSFL